MKNNAFAQVHRAFYSLIVPNKKHADAICIGVTGNKRAASPSIHHPKAQGRRQTVEHVHQAVERRHALPQAKGRHRAADPRRPEEAP